MTARDTSSAPRRSASSGTRITKQLSVFAIVCLCVIAAVTVIATLMAMDNSSAVQLREEIVVLNEVAHDASIPGESHAIAQAQDVLRQAADAHEGNAVTAVLLVCVAAVVCLVALSIYLYVSVVRPFSKLQGFAEEVASGNLELPLEYERSNPFGKFAWAFDHMRSELKRARVSELTAIEENKTVIASLAHDLRTPIASIRTYAEALNMGLVDSEAERTEYTAVIERKCIEVSQLVDDMLTHSLAELDRISVECSPVPVAPLLHQAVDDFGLGEASVIHADDAVVRVDELRLRQAIENLLVNASKYAPGCNVEVSGAVLDEHSYRITVRDFGPGMAPEDIPFAFNRFYRGGNAHDIEGSGLGLYVVRYVVQRMGGQVMLQNARPGLEIFLDVPLARS